MDFTTGGVQPGGFYGAGMAGGRFDRKKIFFQQYLKQSKSEFLKFHLLFSDFICATTTDNSSSRLLGKI